MSAQLLSLLVNVELNVLGTAYNQAFRIIDSIKIRHIEIWSPVQAQGNSATCSVTWGNSTAPQACAKEFSDTSVSVTDPAHVRCTPPRGSRCDFWITGDSENVELFQLKFETHSIIDVAVQLILIDGRNPYSAYTLTAPVPFYGVYASPLDGLAPGGAGIEAILPVGLSAAI